MEWKIFIFSSVDYVTHSYHSSGGVVIIAPTEEAARGLTDARKLEGLRIAEDEWEQADVYSIIVPEEMKPSLLVFPDAGCC